MTEPNIRTPLPGETEDEMWDRLLADAHEDLKKPGPWTPDRFMKWAPLFDEEYWEAVRELRGPNSVHAVHTKPKP